MELKVKGTKSHPSLTNDTACTAQGNLVGRVIVHPQLEALAELRVARCVLMNWNDCAGGLGSLRTLEVDLLVH